MVWNDASRIRCRLATVCSQRWDDLAPTDRYNVRHCDQCDQDVHQVTSELDFEVRAARGQCVSLLASDGMERLTGPPLPPPLPRRRLPVLIALLLLAAAGAAVLLLM
jgi:hypothetical protein